MAKILVIEDNEALGEMLVERLGRRGHQVMLASDAQAAQSNAKSSEPDLILLEAQLRGADDWATARALKFDDHTRDIPIIGLLASDSEEAREQATLNGCAELHFKPVDFVKLLQQIDALAKPKDEAEAEG